MRENIYALGLDVGANSVGWAVIRIEENSDGGYEPIGLEGFGSRVFDAGMEGDIEGGREASRNQGRREARSSRRRLSRHVMRLEALFNALRKHQLLPEPKAALQAGKPGKAAARRRYLRDYLSLARNEVITGLDRALKKKWQARLESEGARPETIARVPHHLPYLLRARALDDKLHPHEIGRAFYHIAQRRGFASNRKSKAKKDEEDGIVKAAISTLEGKMEEAGARTLGEYFAGLDPVNGGKIRKQYTGRDMYLQEFRAIWNAQSGHHPDILTPQAMTKIEGIIFFQRPLKSQHHLVGRCELEPARQRAPKACLEFQRFRMLAQVNNLSLLQRDGTRLPLENEQRERLLAVLEVEGDQKSGAVKKILGIKSNIRLNFDFPGSVFMSNRTAKSIIDAIGLEKWESFGREEQEALATDLLSIRGEDVLERRAAKHWKLAPEAARELSRVELEDDYASLSRKALRNLLPLLEKGMAEETAKHELYPPQPRKPSELLRPVEKALPHLRNPTVARTLTELRKVVNTLLRQYGKPALVRVELAREIKQGKKARQEVHKRNVKRGGERKKAAERLLKETNIRNPSRQDIEKVLLMEECGFVCPYTGEGISMARLFGEPPDFEVEHIIPLSRSLDDSFLNKTLCQVAENRRKHNRTPWEAYHQDEEKYEEILQRVERFKGNLKDEKQARFRMEPEQVAELLAGFSERQMNDTRYASRLAMEYLGELYGGVVDAAGRRRVQASSGGATAFLRGLWGLNRIVPDIREKRDDHRHHAVDALVVALTTPGAIKMLADAAQDAHLHGRSGFAPLPAPWEGFREQVRESIARAIASHRVHRRLSGPLHEETLYSRRAGPDGEERVQVRKELSKMRPNEIGRIADDRVREAVQKRLAELGGDVKAFQKEENHPWLETRDGRRIPIHKARIDARGGVTPIGGDTPRARRVMTGNNHHLEIFEVKDAKGRVRWEGEVVTLFQALERKKAGLPVIRKERGPEARFVFSLASGETIALELEKGAPELFRVRTVTSITQGGKIYSTIHFCRINDARLKKEMKESGDWFSKMMEPLRKAGCRKIALTPLGEARWAND